MRVVLYSLFILSLALPVKTLAQSYIKSDYIFSSSFREKGNDEKLGSGDLLKISGNYTQPFRVKQNELGQVTAWATSISGSYSKLTNKGLLLDMSPNEVFNGSLNLSHIRPLSKRWSFIASIGGGVYADPNRISWKSVLINGGVIFIHKVNTKLDLGIGAGVTNSYGVPIVMPMAYLKLNFTGKYEFKIDMSSQVEVSGVAKFSNHFHLKLVALEMDGISSVVEKDNRSMIYSSMMMKSLLTPEFKIGKYSTLFLGVGGVWLRTAKLSERTLKSFWNTFKEEDDRFSFKPTGYLTVGFRYGF